MACQRADATFLKSVLTLVQGALDHLIQRHPFMRLAQPAFGQAGQLLALADDQVRLFQRLFQFARFPADKRSRFRRAGRPAQRMQGMDNSAPMTPAMPKSVRGIARTCRFRRLASAGNGSVPSVLMPAE